jgi:HK97 family phage major capsid protein
VQETDPTSSDYSVTASTIAGQVDLSRQLYDFSNPGMDEIIMQDLARDYATKLDIQVISGSAGSGQQRGIRNIASINTVTYTQATPTAAHAVFADRERVADDRHHHLQAGRRDRDAPAPLGLADGSGGFER